MHHSTLLVDGAAAFDEILRCIDAAHRFANPPEREKNMIELQHLQKAYPNSMPLKDVCTTIHKGDVIAVIGASGCGKSTLLRCINMLDPPTGGKIIVGGEDITAPGYDLNRLRMKVGMIFQSFNLFSHQSVIENIMQPQMKLLGRSKQEAYDKAYSLLSVMGLSRQQFQFPDQISGGQQQRVAIARALGYNSNQTFFYVVLPQALRIAFPQIKSGLVDLIKETSIVGYISIADLTRMSDIVRGRTYEAFFPLITTTIIYFVLIWLILFVIKRVEIEMTFRPIRIEKVKKGIRIKEQNR